MSRDAVSSHRPAADPNPSPGRALFGPLLGGLFRRSEFFAFFLGLRAPESGPIRLTQRRVYILPTGYGLMFGVALTLMLIGSINYTLALGYALTFSLSGMALVSMLHTFRNLAGLVIHAGRVEPIFAGETAVFEIHFENPHAHDRYSLNATCGETAVRFDVPARRTVTVRLAVPATRRGALALGRVTLEGRYPLGIFRVWAYVQPKMHTLVYPRPARAPLPPAKVVAEAGATAAAGIGVDDFAGFRPYQPGDSPRHLAWKHAERGGPLLAKTFSGSGAGELWLDWDDAPRPLDAEARLSRLAGWIVAAEAEGYTYGLRLPGVALPGVALPPSRGPAHRAACLAQLALFDVRDRG